MGQEFSTGSEIRRIRLEKGLTQKQLGDLCGMADSAIRKYESGKIVPKIDTLKKIAAALGVDAFSLADIDTATKMIENHMNITAQLDLKERILINVFVLLNDAGKDKAIELVTDLTEIPKYQATPSDES